METSPSINLLLESSEVRPQPAQCARACLPVPVLDLDQNTLCTAVILLERSLLYEIT